MSKAYTIPTLEDYKEVIERVISEPILEIEKHNVARSARFKIYYYLDSDMIYIYSITGYQCNISIECPTYLKNQ